MNGARGWHKAGVIGLLLLAGCAPLPEREPTIASLGPIAPVQKDRQMPEVSLHVVRREYEKALQGVDDPALRKTIKRRIADLHMEEGENRHVEGRPPPAASGYFGLSIAAYQELLQRFPDSPDNDEVLYQLAKGYDLEGQPNRALATLMRLVNEYPQSPRLVEAYFRIGEITFTQRDYRTAEQAYTAILQRPEGSVFHDNAQYMLGWSLFKQGLYKESLQAFAVVLDRLMPAYGDLTLLGKSKRALLDDTLHVMSLALSYLGGAETLAELTAIDPDKQYDWLLYDTLGRLYLDKERFDDSAKAYRAYVRRFPAADDAPVMHERMIRAYVQGDFPQQVLLEKENYVRRYGSQSPFWQTKPAALKASVRPNLKTYLDELARVYHGMGQRQAKAVDNLAQGVSAGAVEPPTYRAAVKERDQSFTKAVQYYQAFLATFPDDDKAAEMHFMLAEALFDAQRYPDAIAVYEQVAYQRQDARYAVKAGYAVIMAYDNQVALLKQRHAAVAEWQDWKLRQVEVQLKFLRTFRQDPRSPQVLANALATLLDFKRYPEALAAAQAALQQADTEASALAVAAYRGLAHSHFALAEYAQAEPYYAKLLRHLPEDAAGRNALEERLAASIYRQGEAAAAAGRLEVAIDHFQRIVSVAPAATIRQTAQYDAASYLLTLERWDSAIAELQALQRHYPDSPFAAEIPLKLAYAYEKSGQWRAAAEAYHIIYQRSDDPETRRESLLLAADYYEKAGDDAKALSALERYAERYATPFIDWMEVTYRLALRYQNDKGTARYRAALERLIQGNEAGGEQRSERSNYLAAWAAARYGDFHLARMQRIRLRLPIANYLPKKQRHMEAGLQRYQQAADYGFVEFAAHATYGMGKLYADFSRALMNSPRPRGLSSLELDQYEVLLEEQAIPFEETAIEIHQVNIERGWNGYYDQWVEKSFAEMARLMPARFDKREVAVSYDQALY